MHRNKQVGTAGEQIAAAFLQSLSYSIVAQNVQLGHDEIDIIAYDPEDDVYVFAEVKTRSVQSKDYWPSINMTQEKKRYMRRAARKWIAEKQSERGYRLDLVCIAGGRIVDHFISVGRDEAQW